MIRRILVVLAAVTNLLLADAVTKEIAAARLKGSAAVSVIDGFFDLAYVENRGCAWGMFQGQVWPLAAFAVAALALIIWKRRSIFSFGNAEGRFLRLAAASAEWLMYAGILGNLVDRVFRGYVIDFLDFHLGGSHFPCFNLADTYITLSAGILVLISFFSGRDSDAATTK